MQLARWSTHALASLATVSPPAFAADWVVAPAGGDFTSIQAALDVAVAGDTVLVLAENKAPGWTATIDGGPELETRYVNLAWHGLPLPPGRHTVLFTYDPPSYRWGLRLSVAGALLWLLMLLFPRHLS